MTMQNFDYREPLMYEQDGTYVTVGQTQFFINQVPELSFAERFDDWVKYYNMCRMYNAVFDAVDEDPDCGYLYWDEKTETVSASYPKSGSLQQIIESVTPLEFNDQYKEDMENIFDASMSWDEDEDEDEEDYWN